MRDLRTTIRLLLAKDDAIPTLGRGFRVLCTVRPFRSPDLPAAGSERKIGCRPCLFLQQEGEAGILAHFLFACSLTGETTRETHADILYQSETPPYQTIWLDPCPAVLRVRKDHLRFSLTASTTCLAPLWSQVGPPDGSGEWLAARLCPPLVRRATIRRHTSSLLHLWFRP
jgi:hypothetical protein